MIRLFAAIAVPEHIGEGLVRHQEGLPGARWRPLDALHITLRFAGEVAENVARDLDTELSAIGVGGTFDVTLAGVGAFGEGARHRRGLGGGRGVRAAAAPGRPLRNRRPPVRDQGRHPRLQAPRHPGLPAPPGPGPGRRLDPGPQPAEGAAFQGDGLGPLFQLADRRRLPLPARGELPAELAFSGLLVFERLEFAQRRRSGVAGDSTGLGRQDPGRSPPANSSAMSRRLWERAAGAGPTRTVISTCPAGPVAGLSSRSRPALASPSTFAPRPRPGGVSWITRQCDRAPVGEWWQSIRTMPLTWGGITQWLAGTGSNSIVPGGAPGRRRDRRVELDLVRAGDIGHPRRRSQRAGLGEGDAHRRPVRALAASSSRTEHWLSRPPAPRWQRRITSPVASGVVSPSGIGAVCQASGSSPVPDGVGNGWPMSTWASP